ncbi:MAG: FAD-dependent monooxygenase, partial [Alphaproteobacteria bacterium]
HQRVADTYRKGRVFLAGDAAHLNNPLGGMGLNGGLHDAVNLTRRLDKVWHGAADDRTFDEYEAQRRPAAIKGVNSITERNKRLMEERDPEVRARNLDAWRKIDADPALMYQHALDASMIGTLREFGMGDFRSTRRQSAA